jgi:hypothetical protein
MYHSVQVHLPIIILSYQTNIKESRVAAIGDIDRGILPVFKVSKKSQRGLLSTNIHVDDFKLENREDDPDNNIIDITDSDTTKSRSSLKKRKINSSNNDGNDDWMERLISNAKEDPKVALMREENNKLKLENEKEIAVMREENNKLKLENEKRMLDYIIAHLPVLPMTTPKDD